MQDRIVIEGTRAINACVHDHRLRGSRGGLFSFIIIITVEMKAKRGEKEIEKGTSVQKKLESLVMAVFIPCWWPCPSSSTEVVASGNQ